MSEDPDEPRPPFRIRERIQNRAQLNHRPQSSQRAREEPPRPVFRIGGSIIQSTTSEDGVGLQTIDAATQYRVARVESQS